MANNYDTLKGGSDRVFLSTVALLKKEGHRVTEFTPRNADSKPNDRSQFLPLAPDTTNPKAADFLHYLYNRNAALGLAGLLQAEGPFDLAHLHIYYGRLTPAILPVLERAGVPIVQSLHEYKLACPTYSMERNGVLCTACVGGSTLNILRHRCKNGSLTQSAAVLVEYWSSRLQGDIRKIDRFICLSRFQFETMVQAGLPKEKLTLLPNFVDTSRFRPSAPRARSDYLLYSGRIERLKGLETLISAALQSDKRLLICGRGSWETEMMTRIANKTNIQYLGFQTAEQVQKLVADAKAVVVPSEWYENCPMTVLEAKACATPVIGTRIGGIPELIRDGIDGFLCETGSVSALSGAFERLDAADRDAMGQAGLADILDRFSPASHYAALVDIYRSLAVR